MLSSYLNGQLLDDWQCHYGREVSLFSDPAGSVLCPWHGRLARYGKWRACCFTYVTAHFPTLPSVYLRHSSFSNPSVASSLTSQLVLQPFRRFTYDTAHSPTLPLLHIRHSSFSNPSFASYTSQALHLRHLASRPCLLPLIVEWHKYVAKFIVLEKICDLWPVYRT